MSQPARPRPPQVVARAVWRARVRARRARGWVAAPLPRPVPRTTPSAPGFPGLRRVLRAQLTPAVTLALPAVLAAVLLLARLRGVPGLHGDEAWVALRVRELAAGPGDIRWDGMNFYTGGLHAYLAWPIVKVLGETVPALRAPGALLTLAALLAVVATLMRWWGRRTVLGAGLLLASSPAVVILGRFGIEVTALTPALAAAAFAGFAQVAHRPPSWASLAVALGAGFALGVAAYSHLVALPLALAVALVALIFYARGLVFRPEVGAAVIGAVAGFSPRLFALLREDSVRSWLGRGEGPSFLPDLRYLPALIEWGWDGRILYQRFAGGRGDAWPYPLVAVGVLLLVRLGSGVSLRPSRAALAAATGLGAAAVMTAALAPHLAPRYFVACFWMLPVLLAWLARPLLEGPRRWARHAAVATLALVVALNLLYLGRGYLQPFLEKQGGLSTFRIGTRLTETSNHFVPTDDLLAELRRRGIGRVYAGFFIAMPLRVLDRGRDLEIVTWDKDDPPPREPQFGAPPTAVVFYDGPGPDVIDKGPVRYHRDRGFPPHFRVYVAELMSP